MTKDERVTSILLAMLLLLAMVVASCAPIPQVDTAPASPRAWFGGPPDGSEVPPDEVSTMCHSFAPGGVAQIELWVNGAFANAVPNPTPGAEYFTAVLTFEPTGPGTYALLCRAYDQTGQMAQSGRSVVVVSGEVPTPTPTETSVPTAAPTTTEVPPTPVEPTGTPVPPRSKLGNAAV